MIGTLENFQRRFEQAIRDVGFTPPARNIQTVEMEEHGDDGKALLIPGGIYVSVHLGTWNVDLETVYPGVRYYRDGSGEPPSSDFDTKYAGRSGTQALAAAVRLYAESQLAGVLENLGIEEQVDEDAHAEEYNPPT